MNIDFMALLKIIGVDIMLGVDNAVVIAMACAALPVALRGRAVMLGTAGAVGLRAILLAIAGLLFAIPFVKLFAGAYLLFIGYQLLANQDEGETAINAPDRMLSAVKTIIVADFMMSLDNVLAVVGAAQGAGDHSTLYAIAGIALSIPIIVFGAQAIMRLMDKYPAIITLGGGLLGWVGAEMMLSDDAVSGVLTGRVEHLAIQSAAFIGVCLIGTSKRRERIASA